MNNSSPESSAVAFDSSVAPDTNSAPSHFQEHKIEDWYLPEFDNTQAAELGANYAATPHSDTNALGMNADWYSAKRQQMEMPNEVVVPVPMTVEELDAIRQAAYEDGYNEGKEQGYQDGLATGNEEGRIEGESAGKSEGLAQGLAEGEALVAAKAAAWEQLQIQLHAPLEQVNIEVEAELIRVATGLAEALIKTEVSFNHEVLLQTLKQAIDALPVLEQKITISLHPDDLAIINEYYPPAECTKRDWLLMAEPTLKVGDLVVNNEVSSVEMAMELRIQQMMRRFLIANKPSAS